MILSGGCGCTLCCLSLLFWQPRFWSQTLGARHLSNLVQIRTDIGHSKLSIRSPVDDLNATFGAGLKIGWLCRTITGNSRLRLALQVLRYTTHIWESADVQLLPLCEWQTRRISLLTLQSPNTTCYLYVQSSMVFCTNPYKCYSHF